MIPSLYAGGTEEFEALLPEARTARSPRERALAEARVSLEAYARQRGYGPEIAAALWALMLRRQADDPRAWKHREGRDAADWAALDRVRLAALQPALFDPDGDELSL